MQVLGMIVFAVKFKIAFQTNGEEFGKNREVFTHVS
jgi:hypothetical protein